VVKSERNVRYSAEEIDAMRRRGESRTDWAYVDALTEEELEASIDFEEEGEFDLSTAQPGIPGLPPPLTIRLDAEVMEWFMAQGDDFRIQMNAVLRDFVAAQEERDAAISSRP
jgi:uncharacterized protein (DUF4415 family)